MKTNNILINCYMVFVEITSTWQLKEEKHDELLDFMDTIWKHFTEEDKKEIRRRIEEVNKHGK